jgi:hypothetical protein
LLGRELQAVAMMQKLMPMTNNENLFLIMTRYGHGGLTVCVTCAGAGTAKPSNQKNAKARETA